MMKYIHYSPILYKDTIIIEGEGKMIVLGFDDFKVVLENNIGIKFFILFFISLRIVIIRTIIRKLWKICYIFYYSFNINHNY